MSHGRKLRIDQGLRREPAARWQAPLLMHSLCAVGIGMIAFNPPPANQEGMTQPQALLFLISGWVLLGVLLECLFRFTTSFEVQLLAGAVRVKNWWRDELLIEPEIVGGRITWLNEIRLRAGERSASIRLGWFPKRQEQAAVIEHCSQFLSPEQQAAYGHEWAKRFHRLITPAKPPTARGMLWSFGITYGIGWLLIIACCESMIASGVEENLHGGPLRLYYLAWTIMGAFLGLLVFFIHRAERIKPSTA